MEFRQTLATLRKSWVATLVITAIAVTSAVAYSLLATPTYQARS